MTFSSACFLTLLSKILDNYMDKLINCKIIFPKKLSSAQQYINQINYYIVFDADNSRQSILPNSKIV